jgi:hypothetical protein
MHKLVLASSLVAVIVVAGCGAGQAAIPSPSPVLAAPSATPGVLPSADPSPIATPATPVPATPTPNPTIEPVPSASPSPAALSADEKYLLAGIQRGAVDCEPVRSALPPRATAGIECAAESAAVARVGFYLFDDEADLLAAYFARMKAEGVATDSGETCLQGESEHAYYPGDGEIVANRAGCFINDAGIANYRATFPARVYIGVLGRSADMAALEDWAWIGQKDTPGSPTLWSEPGT